ncbi:MAG TPA: metallophosphoesterase family protein [Anaerolineales bacterium]|nr:metallophosphoesterase family protein [Anaerolineales bacterium]
MRILVISDIHANLTALEAVIKHASQVDAVWCLGDLVGYGPDPNECVTMVRSLPNLVCVLGNHDAAVLRQIDSSAFNPEARQVIYWTQSELTNDNLDFLKNLPERAVQDHVTLVHGSPRQPVWEYLLDTHNATHSFEYFDTQYCFVGHTHLPVMYHFTQGDQSSHLFIPTADSHVLLNPRAILNPGSVGQPRDRNPKAAYAIYYPEKETWEPYRVPYEIAAVQNRMQAARLPERHIQRLSGGW